jgi:hypothetical protein
LSVVESLKKSLTFFGIVWVGISSFIAARVIFNDSEDWSELLIVLYLLALAPVMAIEAVLFTYTNELKLQKYLRVAIFSITGGFFICTLFTLGIYVEKESYNIDLSLFIAAISIALHFMVSIRLPWKGRTWV